MEDNFPAITSTFSEPTVQLFLSSPHVKIIVKICCKEICVLSWGQPSSLFMKISIQ